MTPEQAVELTKQMRAAGASRFTLSEGRLSVVLLPPEPPKLTAIAEQLGELPVGEREKLLKAAKKELDADLYGAGGG